MADDNVLSLLPALLREIRDEIRSTNDSTRAELREVRDEISGMRADLSSTNTRLDSAMRERLRQGTAIAELQLAMYQNTQALRVMIEELKRQGERIDKQGERIDNVLLGVPGQTLRDMQRRLSLVEQTLGLTG